MTNDAQDDAHNDAEQIIGQIQRHLKAHERYLLGLEGEPADALAELDAADELAARL